jgi:hypothetical protein
MRSLFLGRRRFECHAAALLKGCFSKSSRYLGDNFCDAMRQLGAVDINCAIAGLAGRPARPERFARTAFPRHRISRRRRYGVTEAIWNLAA